MFKFTPGTDVMVLKLFSPKNLAKILAFFAQTTVTFCKKLIITLVFEKNVVFFAENLQKSQKIVIITSTPGCRNGPCEGAGSAESGGTRRRSRRPRREELRHRPGAGTDVMIFKIFSPKISAKKLEILTQNKAKLCKILIITLVFEKNANFFAENCRKSQKIVIITPTPDPANTEFFQFCIHL
jgi:hypothetical protein